MDKEMKRVKRMAKVGEYVQVNEDRETVFSGNGAVGDGSRDYRVNDILKILHVANDKAYYTELYNCDYDTTGNYLFDDEYVVLENYKSIGIERFYNYDTKRLEPFNLRTNFVLVGNAIGTTIINGERCEHEDKIVVHFKKGTATYANISAWDKAHPVYYGEDSYWVKKEGLIYVNPRWIAGEVINKFGEDSFLETDYVLVGDLIGHIYYKGRTFVSVQFDDEDMDAARIYAAQNDMPRALGVNGYWVKKSKLVYTCPPDMREYKYSTSPRTKPDKKGSTGKKDNVTPNGILLKNATVIELLAELKSRIEKEN